MSHSTKNSKCEECGKFCYGKLCSRCDKHVMTDAELDALVESRRSTMPGRVLVKTPRSAPAAVLRGLGCSAPISKRIRATNSMVLNGGS